MSHDEGVPFNQNSRRVEVIAKFLKEKELRRLQGVEPHDEDFERELAKAREFAGTFPPFTQVDIDTAIPAIPILEELIRQLGES